MENSVSQNILECLINLDPEILTKLGGVIILYLFIPFTSFTYIAFRRQRRDKEIKRIFNILQMDKGEYYQDIYRDRFPWIYFFLGFLYISFISLGGLTMLFLGGEIGLLDFPQVSFNNTSFPVEGSRLISGIAFLGAYIWGLQHIFRRYSVIDLRPTVYFRLGIRMILASVIALIIFNAYKALSIGEPSDTKITAHIWPGIAFLIGMFPQRGLNLLIERIRIVQPISDPSVRKAPLDMIEGITIHDKLRLEEQGLDSCYDLALVDFIPLLIKTPYSARELVDWILQAKLCVHFGAAVKELRQHGIRTALDLQRLNPEDISQLASEIALTESSISSAKTSIDNDTEIGRLCKVSHLLGEFVRSEVPPPPKEHEN